MGNQCKGKYCYKPDYNEILHTPMEIFNKIVKIQAIIRGFIARRQTKILKANLNLLLQERQILKKYGFGKLNHILTPKLLRKKVEILQNQEFVYIGEVNDQKQPHGFGRKIYQNQTYKEGEFINGTLRRGTYYFNGNSLIGQFSNNLLHGRGKRIYKNGTVYEGSFEKGIFDGYGKLTDQNGNIFEGQFKNALLNGEGEFIGKDGKYYVGEWLQGKYHGKGELLFPDGKKYIGQFEQNYRHGYGELITQAGKIYGEWRHGKLISKGLQQFEESVDKLSNGFIQ